MAEYTYDILASGIEQGTITSSGDQSASDCVRSIGFIEFIETHKGRTSVTLNIASSESKTIQVDFLGYRSTNSSDIVCDLYWYNSPYTFDLTSYSGIKYFRVVIRYSDRSNITPSEITSANLVETYRSPWRIENGIFTRDGLPDMIPRLVPPYPSGLWYIENDIFEHVGLPDMANSGAFKDCTNLRTAIFPSTLTYIGPYAFSGTALTDVTLPDGCRYFDTSFPPRCVVHGGHRE